LGILLLLQDRIPVVTRDLVYVGCYNKMA
jgi:hypothetical protein